MLCGGVSFRNLWVSVQTLNEILNPPTTLESLKTKGAQAEAPL